MIAVPVDVGVVGVGVGVAVAGTVEAAGVLAGAVLVFGYAVALKRPR